MWIRQLAGMARNARCLVFDPIRLTDCPRSTETDRRAWLVRIGSATAVGVFAQGLSMWPAFQRDVLVQGAARVAGVLLGSPVAPAPDGFLLPGASVPVLVSAECSGSGFLVIVAVLLGWHLATPRRVALERLAIALALALPLTVVINAARVACVAQAHRWLIPLFPSTYGTVLHFGTGVAVFLPALIALNFAFEHHAPDRSRSDR